MEHRLILGGEQFLPFARSCVAKLKRLGLPYANQSFEVDGVSIKVRIEPEHEYIRIEENSLVSIPMENGIADVLNIAEININTPLSGTINGTLFEAEYSAPFTVQGLGYSGSWASWRLNPDAVPDHQMAGTVTIGSTKGTFGRIRPDSISRAFSPGYREVTPKTDPVSYEVDPNDLTLREKKQTAIFCPASIFTGKTRLYVQALYGRPLYDYGDVETEVHVEQKAIMDIELVFNGGTTPALKIKSYREKGDESELADILLETHSGVHLDSTGKHWLFNINSGLVTCYPLRPSAHVVKLRRYLAAKSTAFSQKDKDRLEAYILSTCLPDRKQKKVIGAAIGGANMGYGWHWNWSGTEASVVDMMTFDQDATHQGMRSTLYTLKVSRGEDGEFRASQSVGPAQEWSLYRTYWTIMEPNWGTLHLQKTTPGRTIVQEGGGPFYVFYKRDELTVCSVSVIFTPDSTPTRAMSQNPPYSSESAYGAGIQGWTSGANGGWLTDENSTSGYFSMTLSVGDESFGESPVGRTNTKNEYVHTAKTEQAISGPTYGNVFVGADGMYYPTDSGLTFLSVGEYNDSFFVSYTFSISVTQVHVEYPSLVAALVPVNDAESIFVSSSLLENRITSSTLTNYSADYRNPYTTVIRHYPQSGGSYDLRLTGSTRANLMNVVGTSGDSSNTIVTLRDVKKWVGSAASSDALFPGLNMVHDNTQDDIPQAYLTIASANGAAISPGRFGPVNADSDYNAAVFVGNA